MKDNRATVCLLTCLGLSWAVSDLCAQEPRPPYTFKGHEESVTSVAFSPDGKTVASGGYDKVIRLCEEATGKQLAPLKGHTAAVWSVAFNPDGKTIASGAEDGTIRL